jgi:sterol-4alpha-carboxylate 3-dehydrogenase (decarboxylating)
MFQVGDNSNECDWDHVDNVTYGHILAYEKLLDPLDPSKPGPAAGEIFNITGCEPWPLWNYMRRIWFEYNGYKAPFHIVLPYWLAYTIALITVFFQDLLGVKRSGLTPHTVIYATAWRTHNCDKAKRLLGYEPVINTEDGVKDAIAWYKEQEQEQSLTRQPKKQQ